MILFNRNKQLLNTLDTDTANCSGLFNAFWNTPFSFISPSIPDFQRRCTVELVQLFSHRKALKQSTINITIKTVIHHFDLRSITFSVRSPFHQCGFPRTAAQTICTGTLVYQNTQQTIVSQYIKILTKLSSILAKDYTLRHIIQYL